MLVIAINKTLKIIKLKNILKMKFFYKFVISASLPKNKKFQEIGWNKNYSYIKKQVKRL